MEWQNLYDNIMAWLLWLWSFGETKWLVGHVAVNFVAAIAASIYTGEFLLGKTWEVLYKKALPFLLLFGAFALFGEAIDMPAMKLAAFAVLETKLLADLADSLQKVGLKLVNGNGWETPGLLNTKFK